MADMIGVSIVLVLLATAFPAYLAVVWRIWPQATERARDRLTRTPGRSLLFGALLTAAIAVPIAGLLALPNGAAQFLGYAGVVLVLAFAGLGAAGFASRVGSDETTRGFILGAVLTELAMAFPVIGWFLVTPLLLLLCVGAAAFAVLRWMPGARVVEAPTPATMVAAESR